MLRVGAFLVFFTLVFVTRWSPWLPLSAALLSAAMMAVSVAVFGNWGLNQISKYDWGATVTFSVAGAFIAAALISGRVPIGQEFIALAVGGLAGSFITSMCAQAVIYYLR